MGAVQRVYNPGCKFEYMVCLVGGQGAGKSSFLRFLTMENEWFSDDLRKLDDENVFRKIQGHWIIEMAEMLATMKTGRLDENTTSNFSNLWTKTAKAMNVVCDHAILRGEMRSRSGEKLDQYEAYFKAHCQEIAEKRGAKVEFMRENTFLPFYVPEEARIIRIARKALEDMGIEVQINAGGGGMDANIFNQQGVECVGIATGYFENHTTEEYLHLDDFYRSGELVARIIAKI